LCEKDLMTDWRKWQGWMFGLSLVLNLSVCIMAFLAFHSMSKELKHRRTYAGQNEIFRAETESGGEVRMEEQLKRGGRQGELRAAHGAGRKCDLCADNWLFILGAGGRTGSTTALRMFGSVPGFEITGELFGLLNEEEKIWRVLKKRQNFRDPAFTHRQYDLHDFRCSLQHRMKEIVLGQAYDELENKTSVLGFKDVLYTDLRSLHFISGMFPCARFIFSYRNHTADTGALRKLPFPFTERDMPQVWSEGASIFRKVHEMLPSMTSLLELESLSLQSFNSILHDMLHVGGCGFKRLLHDNKNGTYKPDGGQNLDLVEGSCDMGRVNFRLSKEQIMDNFRKWQKLMSEHDPDGAGGRPRYIDNYGTVNARAFSVNRPRNIGGLRGQKGGQRPWARDPVLGIFKERHAHGARGEIGVADGLKSRPREKWRQK